MATHVYRLFVLLCIVAAFSFTTGCKSSRDGGTTPPTGDVDGGTTVELDAGTPEVDAGPADAGPMIPEELLAICRRVSPAYDEACDVERELVHIPLEEPRPARMALFPGIETFNMNGWEWWQQWPDGGWPTYEDTEASDMGMKCSVASALRYAAIMQDPPADVRTMLSDTTWEGRFYNWNDDYSDPASDGDGEQAILWAWQYYLVKWISQTNRDGSCYLPTRSQLEALAPDCLRVAAANDGNIEGCQAPR